MKPPSACASLLRLSAPSPPPLHHCAPRAKKPRQVLAIRRRLVQRSTDRAVPARYCGKVWWLANEHNAKLCAMDNTHCPACARIICIMCKLPPACCFSPRPPSVSCYGGSHCVARSRLTCRAPSAPRGSLLILIPKAKIRYAKSFYQLRRTSKPNHADAHAPLYTAD